MKRFTQVAIIGEFQEGKSTLINSLVGEEVARTGYGKRTTDCVNAYALPGSDCILLDTPGINHSMEDNASTCLGTEHADAFVLMIAGKVLSPSMVDYVQRIVVSPSGFRRPLIPIINDHGANVGIAGESIAALRDAGVNPILFGERMPRIDARCFGKDTGLEYYRGGEAQLRYLFGISPCSNPSPITRICAMLKTVQQLTSFSKNV